MNKNTLTFDQDVQQKLQILQIQNRKMLAVIKLLAICLLVISGILAYLLLKPKINLNNQAACTKEAMICPDGSSVGRSGPNCDFTPCPAPNPNHITELLSNASKFILEKNETIEWKKYTSKKLNLSFEFPPHFRVIDRSEIDDSSGIEIDYDQNGGMSTRWMRIENYDSNHFLYNRYKKLDLASIGSTIALNELDSTIETFKRLSDISIGNYQAKVFESNNTWEIPALYIGYI